MLSKKIVFFLNTIVLRFLIKADYLLFFSQKRLFKEDMILSLITETDYHITGRIGSTVFTLVRFKFMAKRTRRRLIYQRNRS